MLAIAEYFKYYVLQPIIDIDAFPLQKWSTISTEIYRDDSLSISFSHHIEILHKTKNINEILFYMHQTVLHKRDKYDLLDKLRIFWIISTSVEYYKRLNCPMSVATYKTA